MFDLLFIPIRSDSADIGKISGVPPMVALLEPFLEPRNFLQYDFGVAEAIGATVFVGLSALRLCQLERNRLDEISTAALQV